jgi:hypothetical protein
MLSEDPITGFMACEIDPPPVKQVDKPVQEVLPRVDLGRIPSSKTPSPTLQRSFGHTFSDELVRYAKIGDF